jgi:hypothetical protein
MVHKKIRYPGAQPFLPGQQEQFFGRDQNIIELLELIDLEQLIVLYSKSGMGKSSLINAGLIPHLEKSNECIPFKVRFGDRQSAHISPLETIQEQIGRGQHVESLLNRAFSEDPSLWFLLKNWQLKTSVSQYVLIIDQFEELFTYSEEEIIALKSQLADLLHTEIPNHFREQLAAHFDEGGQTKFSDEELELLHQPLDIKLLLAIRSDRMSLMNNLSDYLPNVLRVCYELLPLNLLQAEEAILNPAYLQNETFISPPFDYEDEAIEVILDFLTKERKNDIESFQLQILCHSLEEKVIAEGLSQIKPEHLENLEKVYEYYYETQIARLDTEKEKTAARELIEEAMILEEEERRLSLYEGQIYQNFGFSPDLLAKLVDVHLLRAEPSLKGGYTYEIPHDTLVSPILTAKQRRLEAQRVEAEKKAAEDKERELSRLREQAEQERRKRIRARLIALVSISFAALAMVASGIAIWQFQKAKLSEQKAVLQKERSQALSDSLQYQLLELNKANYNRLLTEGQKQAADAAFDEAEIAFQNAIVLAEQSGYKIDNGGAKARAALQSLLNAWKKHDTYYQLVREGDQLQKKGVTSYTTALKKYRRALAINASDALNEAVSLKIRALNLEISQLFKQYRDRGMLYIRENNPVAACENFKVALSLKPKDDDLNKAFSQYCN